MAYIDFGGPVPAMGGAQATQVVGTLGRLEWDVVRLAQRDGLATLEAPGWLARTIGFLFGRDVNRQLADPRLEALRRYAVLLRHGGDLLASEARRMLRAHDMSEDRIRHARWLVTGQAGMSMVPET